MKYLAMLPWTLRYGTDEDEFFDAAIYQITDNDYHCEYEEEICKEFDVALGTGDSREPKFCPYHYFKMNRADGSTDTQIIPKTGE